VCWGNLEEWTLIDRGRNQRRFHRSGICIDAEGQSMYQSVSCRCNGIPEAVNVIRRNDLPSLQFKAMFGPLVRAVRYD
jgi:hypothetical protein